MKVENFKRFSLKMLRCKARAFPVVASYPGRVGGERRPGIDCLRMRGRFRYISVKL